MRAYEFITEQYELPPEISYPMKYAYVLPGLSAADPYQTYRVGVAVARARSEAKKDDVNPFIEPWSAQTIFGEHSVVIGMNDGIGEVIDAALKMAEIPGGKKLASTATSEEPVFVDTKSPLTAFKGYPTKRKRKE